MATGLNPLAVALAAVLSRLEGLGIQAALVGGLAVGARGSPRFTRDVDLALAVPDDATAERAVHELQSAGYEVVAALDQDVTGRLATVRLRPEHDRGVVVDLLFASSGIEEEIVGAAPSEAVLGVPVRLATLGHLVAMKVLSRDDRSRPQDAGDLRALLRMASDDDVALARAALERIAARGYGRGKDLAAELDRAIADAAQDDPGSLG